MNLRLEVNSEVGTGSTFSLILPSGTAHPIAARPEPAPTPARVVRPVRAHVLLVEDDAAVRDATRMLLRVEGYRVTAVASLAEAEHSAQTEAPDLLITDYHLGNGELGTQVITAVRAAVKTQLRAVLVTGDTSTAVKDLQSGVRLRITSQADQRGRSARPDDRAAE